ncbi:MAG: sialate O-acetylesterase [Candidatus Aminicenantes bacterium]|nr:sialate O-acetylesterase [Candidatus Aminicenantes bacterium]
MKKILSTFTLVAILILAGCGDSAELKLPALFSDHMVLQQNTYVSIWGWYKSGGKVTVKGSWMDEAVSAKGDENKKFMIKVHTPSAGGPYTLMIKASESVLLNNVMIGEVWLCSGQSNMEMPLKGWEDQPVLNSEEAIASAYLPNIHFFQVERAESAVPLDDCTGQWALCTPTTAAEFSAVAFFFGRELFQKLDVPIGLIHSSWGGTPSEAWTSPVGLKSFPEFKEEVETFEDRESYQYPSVLYNGMIHPLIPYTLKGVIWYQGESNAHDPGQYKKLFPAMIQDWRKLWDLGSFPFYFVQIAPFAYGKGKDAAGLRQAQLETMQVRNTGMVVTMDIGELKTIHPANKEEVGRRLALWALAKNYGFDSLVYSGPVYQDKIIEGRHMRILFDSVGSGLTSRGGRLRHFEIAGADRKFVPAEAYFAGDTIIVSSSKVRKPVYVRYLWSDKEQPSLFNKEGLPASPFLTD